MSDHQAELVHLGEAYGVLAGPAGRRLAYMITDRTGNLLAPMLPDDPAGRAMREMITGAIWRAFGCSCRHYVGEGPVYIEDLNCPLHGDRSAGGYGMHPRNQEVSDVNTQDG